MKTVAMCALLNCMKIFHLSILISLSIQLVTMASSVNSSMTEDAQFSTKLFDELIKKQPKDNIIVSPISIRTGLALTYLGAESYTAEELKQGLNLVGSSKTVVAEKIGQFLEDLKSKDGAKLKLANRIYVDQKYDLANTFNTLARKYFDAAAENVNFAEASAAAASINSWVEQQTQQQIKGLISANSLGVDTSAVLVNAIYFKADWLNTFAEVDTSPQDFTVRRGQKVQVNMMYQSDNFQYGDLPDLKASALELPYENTDIVFLIILPEEEQGLTELENKLSSIDLNDISSMLKSEKVQVHLPKFQYEFDISLQPVLEQLGMKTLFTGQANFTSLLQEAAILHISEVKHKAFIEVNEKGTTATGATYIKAELESLILNERIYTFNVDHPFFFAIKDKQNTYFVGHVNSL